MAKPPQKTPSKKPRRVSDTRQIALFEQVDKDAQGKPFGSRLLKVVSFVNPDPSTLYFGPQPLREYLQSRGLKLPLELRQILQEADLSAFLKAYKAGGRQPFHPVLMLGLILLGIAKGVSSLRGLEELACVDLGAIWVCGGVQPDHSTIGRFIDRHAEQLRGPFFITLVAQLVKMLGCKPGAVGIDGSIFEAMSSRFNTLREEAARQRAQQSKQRAEAAPEDAQAQQEAAQAQKVVEEVQRRGERRRIKGRDGKGAQVCPREPEAVIRPLKNGGATRPSYLGSVIANEQRLILGQDVDPSDEKASVGAMLEQHEQITGENPSEALLDAGYHDGKLLSKMLERDTNVLCPSGRADGGQWEKQSRKGKLHKDAFRYDEQQDCYICPMNKTLMREHQSQDDEGRRYVRYKCHACAGCPKLEECCSKSQARTVKRYDGDALKEAMREVMQQKGAQQSYRRRQAWVEPVFAELRYRQGFHRFRRLGRQGAALEFALHCLAYNVKRAIRLLGRQKAAEGGSTAAPHRLLGLMALVRWLLSAFRAPSPSNPARLMLAA